ncbi:MAG: hypothetical protein ACTHJ4_08680 [Candidatus Nucleicultricaceae bacterium]
MLKSVGSSVFLALFSTFLSCDNLSASTRLLDDDDYPRESSSTSHSSTLSLTCPDHNEFENRLSDHRLIQVVVTHLGQSFPFLVWNTWAFGVRHGFMYEKDFKGRKETESDYKKRLHSIANIIASYVNKNPDTIVALQEIPGAVNGQAGSHLFMGLFKSFLTSSHGDEWEGLFKNTAGETFGTLTLYNKERYTGVRFDTMSALEYVCDGIGYNQANRFYKAVFKHLASGITFAHANCHLKYSSTPSMIKQSLGYFFKQDLSGDSHSSFSIVMGDFNLDLTGLQSGELKVAVNPKGSRVGDLQTIYRLDTTDGAILLERGPQQAMSSLHPFYRASTLRLGGSSYMPYDPGITGESAATAFLSNKYGIKAAMHPDLVDKSVELLKVAQIDLQSLQKVVSAGSSYQQQKMAYDLAFENYMLFGAEKDNVLEIAPAVTSFSGIKRSRKEFSHGTEMDLDSFVDKHIRRQLQKRIQDCLNAQFINENEVRELGQKDFSMQVEAFQGMVSPRTKAYVKTHITGRHQQNILDMLSKNTLTHTKLKEIGALSFKTQQDFIPTLK